MAKRYDEVADEVADILVEYTEQILGVTGLSSDGTGATVARVLAACGLTPPIPLPALPHAVIRAEVAGHVRTLSHIGPGTQAPWYGIPGWISNESIDCVVEVLYPGEAFVARAPF